MKIFVAIVLYGSSCFLYAILPFYFLFVIGAKHTFDEGVGKNVANPTAILLSTVKMLDHLGLTEHASKLRAAIREVLTSGKTKTRDLGGFATTQQFTTAVVNSL